MNNQELRIEILLEEVVKKRASDLQDNLLAVFYAPLVTDPLTRLRGGDYVKIDGVYVGRHPFELEPSALTLFGCNLLQVTSNDADVPR